MGKIAIFTVLALAALAEAGGDALVRQGLHAPVFATRIGFMLAGAVVLFAYGVTVNLPSWNFGRLLGVYVALFFVMAQLINFFGFGVPPSMPVYIGGAFIIAGGLILTVWAV